MVIIRLKAKNNGKHLETVIDLCSLSKAKAIPGNWNAKWCNHTKSYYVAAYSKVNGKAGTVLLHRVIMEPPKGLVVDHINHDTLDNTIKNLRVVTYKVNNENLKKPYKPIYERGCRQKIALTLLQNDRPNANSKSGLKGITWDKAVNKWRVKIVYNKSTVYFHRFKDLEEAKKMAAFVRNNLLQKVVQQVIS